MTGLRRRPESISVILPAFNGARNLPSQLRALAGQTYSGSWEAIVVDNGSRDGSLDVARRWSGMFPSLTVATAVEGRGASYARNVGARMAGGSLLAFCDQDDVVMPGWLSALAEAAVGADLVGGAIELKDLNDPLVLSWYPSAWTADWEAGTRPPETMGYLPFVFACNAAVWSDVFAELGGFDERFVGGGEDVVFSWKAQLAGYRLGWVPGALVRKRLRSSIGSVARQLYGYGRGAAGTYREFRDRGVPKPPLAGGLRAWGWLFLHLPDLVRSRKLRGSWAGLAAFRAGMAAGSIRSRVLYL